MKYYLWRCEKCKLEFEVARTSMDHYDVPPEECDNETCDSVMFTKLISKQSPAIKKGDGWHRDEYTATRSIK